jgi:hypothetical protein
MFITEAFGCSKFKDFDRKKRQEAAAEAAEALQRRRQQRERHDDLMRNPWQRPASPKKPILKQGDGAKKKRLALARSLEEAAALLHARCQTTSAWRKARRGKKLPSQCQGIRSFIKQKREQHLSRENGSDHAIRVQKMTWRDVKLTAAQEFSELFGGARVPPSHSCPLCTTYPCVHLQGVEQELRAREPSRPKKGTLQLNAHDADTRERCLSMRDLVECTSDQLDLALSTIQNGQEDCTSEQCVLVQTGPRPVQYGQDCASTQGSAHACCDVVELEKSHSKAHLGMAFACESSQGAGNLPVLGSANATEVMPAYSCTNSSCGDPSPVYTRPESLPRHRAKPQVIHISPAVSPSPPSDFPETDDVTSDHLPTYKQDDNSSFLLPGAHDNCHTPRRGPAEMLIDHSATNTMSFREKLSDDYNSCGGAKGIAIGSCHLNTPHKCALAKSSLVRERSRPAQHTPEHIQRTFAPSFASLVSSVQIGAPNSEMCGADCSVITEACTPHGRYQEGELKAGGAPHNKQPVLLQASLHSASSQPLRQENCLTWQVPNENDRGTLIAQLEGKHACEMPWPWPPSSNVTTYVTGHHTLHGGEGSNIWHAALEESCNLNRNANLGMSTAETHTSYSSRCPSGTCNGTRVKRSGTQKSSDGPFWKDAASSSSVVHQERIPSHGISAWPHSCECMLSTNGVLAAGSSTSSCDGSSHQLCTRVVDFSSMQESNRMHRFDALELITASGASTKHVGGCSQGLQVGHNPQIKVSPSVVCDPDSNFKETPSSVRQSSPCNQYEQLHMRQTPRCEALTSQDWEVRPISMCGPSRDGSSSQEMSDRRQEIDGFEGPFCPMNPFFQKSSTNAQDCSKQTGSGASKACTELALQSLTEAGSCNLAEGTACRLHAPRPSASWDAAGCLDDMLADVKVLKGLQQRVKMEIAAVHGNTVLDNLDTSTKSELHVGKRDDAEALSLHASGPFKSGSFEECPHEGKGRRHVHITAHTEAHMRFAGRHASVRVASEEMASAGKCKDGTNELVINKCGNIVQSSTHHSQINELQDPESQNQHDIKASAMSDQILQLEEQQGKHLKSATAPTLKECQPGV